MADSFWEGGGDGSRGMKRPSDTNDTHNSSSARKKSKPVITGSDTGFLHGSNADLSYADLCNFDWNNFAFSNVDLSSADFDTADSGFLPSTNCSTQHKHNIGHNGYVAPYQTSNLGPTARSLGPGTNPSAPWDQDYSLVQEGYQDYRQPSRYCRPPDMNDEYNWVMTGDQATEKNYEVIERGRQNRGSSCMNALAGILWPLDMSPSRLKNTLGTSLQPPDRSTPVVLPKQSNLSDPLLNSTPHTTISFDNQPSQQLKSFHNAEQPISLNPQPPYSIQPPFNHGHQQQSQGPYAFPAMAEAQQESGYTATPGYPATGGGFNGELGGSSFAGELQFDKYITKEYGLFHCTLCPYATQSRPEAVEHVGLIHPNVILLETTTSYVTGMGSRCTVGEGEQQRNAVASGSSHLPPTQPHLQDTPFSSAAQPSQITPVAAAQTGYIPIPGRSFWEELKVRRPYQAGRMWAGFWRIHGVTPPPGRCVECCKSLQSFLFDRFLRQSFRICELRSQTRSRRPVSESQHGQDDLGQRA